MFKNVGFVNYKWTEILVEDEEDRENLKRRSKESVNSNEQCEDNNPMDEYTDKYIRVNHKTYVPV